MQAVRAKDLSGKAAAVVLLIAAIAGASRIARENNPPDADIPEETR